MAKTIITLGLKGAGKDTYANSIANEEQNLTRIALAMPLKEISMKLFGLTFAEVEDREIKERKTSFDIHHINNMVVQWSKDFFKEVGVEMPNWMFEELAWVNSITHNPQNNIQITNNQITISPRDLQRLIGSKEWLRGVSVADEMISLYTLNKIHKMHEENQTAIVTDCRMESEVQLLGDNLNNNPVEFVLIIRYFTENGVMKSYVENDGHWTESLNATLTDTVLDKINDPFNSIVFSEKPETWQHIQEMADERLAAAIYDICRLNAYKNITFKVHFNKQHEV